MKLSRLLLLLPLLALAGCNSGGTTANSASTATGGAPDTEAKAGLKVGLLTSGQINDQGWNQLAYEGLQKLEADGHSITNQVVNDTSRKNALSELGDQGYNLVFCHGGEFGTDTLSVAAQYKETKYVIVAGNDKQDPNVATLIPKLEEATYLLGMTAGGMTKTGKIGVIGGLELDVIQSTFDAFERGVKAANPKAEVMVKWVGNFDDQNKGKAIARSLIASGADILFHNADQAGKGMFAAAEESTEAGKPVYVFGSNRNQNGVSPTITLASAVIELPKAFEDVAKSVQDGSFKPDLVELNLKNGSIAVEWNPALKAKVPAATLKQVEAAAAKIKSGELKIQRKV